GKFPFGGSATPDYGPAMPAPTTSRIAELRSLLGEANFIDDAAQMAPYLREPRRRFHVPAMAVATPGTVAELQALMRWCNANRVPVVPQGGNTGLVGGQVPLNGDEIIVSTARLTAVRAVDAAAGHMTLEAGVILEEAHRIAEDAGALFPLWIASQRSEERRVGKECGARRAADP